MRNEPSWGQKANFAHKRPDRNYLRLSLYFVTHRDMRINGHGYDLVKLYLQHRQQATFGQQVAFG